MNSPETCLYGKPINKTTYKDIALLINFVRDARGEEELRIYADLLTKACEAFGVAPPDIEKIRHAIDLINPHAAEIIRKIDEFINENPEANHHYEPELIAINLPQARARGIDITKSDLKVLRHHLRYRSLKTVRSRVLKRAIHCLVIAR
jgi:hypothetical protein